MTKGVCMCVDGLGSQYKVLKKKSCRKKWQKLDKKKLVSPTLKHKRSENNIKLTRTRVGASSK